MSIDDAIAHYSKALTEFDTDAPAEFAEAPTTISTTFSSVEIEVPALQTVSAG